MAKEEKTKNLGGRPLKFKSEKELQKKIDAYFADCDPHAVMVWAMVGRKQQRTGKTVLVPEKVQAVSDQIPYTVSGLASYLETDRQTLINYQERERFFDTIKKAKSKIEAFAELSLHRARNPAGVIFSLKNNYKWKDNFDVNQSGEVHHTGLEDITEEKLNAKINDLTRKAGVNPIIGGKTS